MNCRFAIDGSTDFSTAQNHVKALGEAPADLRSRLSTTVSVKAPATTLSEVEVGKKEKKEGGKEKRRDSGKSDGKRHKKVKS